MLSKLLPILLALAPLAPLTTSAPTPHPPRESALTCFNTCVSEIMCIASYPEGCICQNNVRLTCASKCSLPERPQLNNCDLPVDRDEIISRDLQAEVPVGRIVRPEDVDQELWEPRPVVKEYAGPTKREDAEWSMSACYNSCVESWSCIQKWPESCLCMNEVRTRCSDRCNGWRVALEVCELKDDPVRE